MVRVAPYESAGDHERLISKAERKTWRETESQRRHDMTGLICGQEILAVGESDPQQWRSVSLKAFHLFASQNIEIDCARKWAQSVKRLRQPIAGMAVGTALDHDQKVGVRAR